MLSELSGYRHIRSQVFVVRFAVLKSNAGLSTMNGIGDSSLIPGAFQATTGGLRTCSETSLDLRRYPVHAGRTRVPDKVLQAGFIWYEIGLQASIPDHAMNPGCLPHLLS